ncbi:SusC/RagA family TonB-linked outer membrane protein [Mucilaginibacter sp. UR6-11]|uniref:SusC/RagA family TonB-linked outer membrane protein n=1 Tax=Mucilaginibacter sp. UR6-11 TaxID=1435644 RepID=UPI001E4AADA1|nr:SusC/RagA family TonB-linked outer membrane protein [Mucilaginibacter sp. UR6-11]MCC8426469.1 SusC/RagA family TonB-linked outer membrane protein [Mucilaginibacter sp. UR6-11]
MLLLLAAILHVSAASFAQQVSLREKNEPLKKVLRDIQQQTGYDFFVNSALLKDAALVTIDLKNVSIESALSSIFSKQHLDYLIKEKTIIIRLKEPGSSSPKSTTPPADVVPLNGKVTDQQGNPLPGATLTDKITGTIGITGQDGFFHDLPVNPTDTLKVSYVGYLTRTIAVAELLRSAKPMVTIILQTDEVKLSQVAVVSNGYQELPKERATGSFDYVSNGLLNRSVSTNILDRLNGVTSGILFNTRNPGYNIGASPLNIRGTSTIFANNQPLVVVDNFPYDGDLSMINPNDVENVTILKDAAASSIWGARAGNGVIVITTKRGRVNQPLHISFNTNVTASQRPDLFYDPTYLPATDYIDVEQYLFKQGYFDGTLGLGAYAPVSPVVDILNRERNGSLSGADAGTQLNALRNVDARTQLSKYFYRPAVNWQNALSLSGGSDKATYFFSAGYDQNRQNQAGSSDSRITINSQNTFTPVKNLEITAGIAYTETRSDADDSLFPTLNIIYPYTQLADATGNPLPVVARAGQAGYNPSFLGTIQNNGFLDWSFSPLDELRRKLKTQTYKQYDTRAQAGIKYTLVKGLAAEVKYQYERGSGNLDNLALQDSYYARNLINTYSIIDPSGNVTGYNMPLGGVLNKRDNTLNIQNGRAQLDYNYSGGKSVLTAIAGVEAREFSTAAGSSTYYGYDPTTLISQQINSFTYFPINPTGNYLSLPASQGALSGADNRYRSYFSNAAYTYEGKYTLSGSARIDQSNLFGVKTNQKSVPLWSVGGKWDLDKETFYHMDWLPRLKLRATYGFSGNIDNNITAVTTAIFTPDYDFNGRAYTEGGINSAGDPELRWETIGMLNLGLDFALRNEVISGSLEYYRKSGSGLIGDTYVPSSTGYTQFRGNFADMTGQGIDLQLNSVNVSGKFRWTSNLLLSYTTDKVTKYNGPPSSTGLSIVVDRPLGGVYAYAWGGLDPANGNPRVYLNGVLTEDYNTLIGVPVKDRKYVGPSSPPWFGSIRNNFSYHAFSLSANITYAFGSFFQRSALSYANLYSGAGANKEWLNRWQQSGDEAHTNVPSMVYPADPARDGAYAGSTAVVDKGDIVRLRDISFGYTLDKTRLHNPPFSSVRFYLYANNLAILWRANKDGLDPDFLTGIPQPRTLSLGMNVNF